MASSILLTSNGLRASPGFASHGCLKSRFGAPIPSLGRAIPSLARRRGGGLIVKCEQGASSSAGGEVGIWVGRFAMLGFVGTLAVEIGTGKGLLETAGLTTPAPIPALAVAGVLGVIAALGIFRSAPKE
ncbi:LHC-related protein, partial [Selaginella moellendorffii]|eukprot:XP_002992625.1 stress enhanced protein 1, chloroplastic [Selaginella moellendorffii]